MDLPFYLASKKPDPCRVKRKLYKQVEGVSLSSPLDPTLANTFLVHLEKNWLQNCPSDFKPYYYRGYVDDIFVHHEDRATTVSDCSLRDSCTMAFLNLSLDHVIKNHVIGRLGSIYRSLKI